MAVVPSISLRAAVEAFTAWLLVTS